MDFAYGAPFINVTIAIMTYYQKVYTDISAISNPDIYPTTEFYSIMKRVIDAGLEYRKMFGSDNGEINKCIKNINKLNFLTNEQKEKIYYKNAEKFFI